MACYEMLDAACDLRLAAVFVGAYPCRLALNASERSATHRAGAHKLNRAAVGFAAFQVHAHDFRNDFATFFHIQVVAFVNVELANDVFVVQRCTLHDGARQQHRLKVGYWRNHAGATHFKTDELQRRALALWSEFVGNGPSWRFGGAAKVEPLANGIEFKHQAIGGNRQILALHVPLVDEVLHGINRIENCVLSHFESPFLQRLHAPCVGAEVVFAK